MTTRQEEIAKQKPKRVPLGRRNILTVSGLQDIADFHYHWFNDNGDRLYKCREAGYEFVEKSGLAAGDMNAESARGTSSLMKKGVGGGYTAYLMRIPMEFYKQDQRAKQVEVNDLVAETKLARGVNAADPNYGKTSYGKIEVE